MEDRKKFGKAVEILKSGTQYVYKDFVITEEDFNKVQWVTGVNENGTAVTTTTNPHAELTWIKVKEEMDKL